ncbi:MAG: ISL3 family transposase [Gemmataceae bacterium]
MFPTDSLLPVPAGFAITDLAFAGSTLVVAAASTATEAACPVCASRSPRTHSRYRRTIADLPFGGRTCVLRLVVRRFRCTNAGCERRIFCERFPKWLGSHARATDRLQTLQREIGSVAGGEAGSRLATELAAPVSGDTLIRRVLALPESPAEPVRCLGIDDFAFRKGQNYGTILIDLERGCVIDLLKTREAADVEAWLKQHPGIEVITRDRATAYANAATGGAPQATQVADRWHLLKNLREAAERLLLIGDASWFRSA